MRNFGVAVRARDDIERRIEMAGMFVDCPTLKALRHGDQHMPRFRYARGDKIAIIQCVAPNDIML